MTDPATASGNCRRRLPPTISAGKDAQPGECAQERQLQRESDQAHRPTADRVRKRQRDEARVRRGPGLCVIWVSLRRR